MTTTTPCVHHWIIESVAGSTPQGRCRNCGEEREFQNRIDRGDWQDFGNTFSGGYTATPRRAGEVEDDN